MTNFAGYALECVISSYYQPLKRQEKNASENDFC